MRRICFTLMVVLFALSGAHAQVTTYFYGRNKVQSKNETAALYSVAIYENNTMPKTEHTHPLRTLNPPTIIAK